MYVKDKYELGLKEFFNTASPWAYQSLTARMLETVRKGYWQPDEAVQQKLAVDYAVSVVEKGVACCDHTCNNPLLNQMVISILSIPGVVAPEIVEQFQIAVEQAAQKELDQQVTERKELVTELTAAARPIKPQEKQEKEEDAAAKTAEKDGEQVEGYRMEKISSTDEATKLTSSGMEWLAGLVVLSLLGLIAFGSRKKI